MQAETALLYVADPMCSWCWGFAPQLRSLETAFPDLPVRLVLGGLAPDTDEPMPAEMRAYVQRAWDAVEERTGARFDRSFWDGHVPDIRRSTYPACRAVILARAEGKERPMFDTIQEAYYMDALNPSADEVLVECAERVGLTLREERFLQRLHAEETQARLEEDFRLRRALGADTFPSLALWRTDRTGIDGGGKRAGVGEVLWRGYATAEELIPRIEAELD